MIRKTGINQIPWTFSGGWDQPLAYNANRLAVIFSADMTPGAYTISFQQQGGIGQGINMPLGTWPWTFHSDEYGWAVQLPINVIGQAGNQITIIEIVCVEDCQ